MNSCNACHQLSHDGALQVECEPNDVAFNLNGGLFAQVQLVPQLRGVYKKFDTDLYGGFGLLHDGREEREHNDHPLDTFLQNFFQGIINAGLDDDLIAFVQGFQSNTMPIVGFQTVASGPAASEVFSSPNYVQDINLMIEQHDLFPSRCDVIAKGHRRRRTARLLPLEHRHRLADVPLRRGNHASALRDARGDRERRLARLHRRPTWIRTTHGGGPGTTTASATCSTLIRRTRCSTPTTTTTVGSTPPTSGRSSLPSGTVNEAITLNPDPIIDTADLGILIGAFGVCP